MSEAAWAFEQVPMNLTQTRTVRVTGLLQVCDDLEEIQVLGQSPGSTRKNDPRVRAFRVRRDLRQVGLQKGDCLLVQPKRLAPNELAVVSVGGALTVRRVVARQGERLVFDPPTDTPHPPATLRVIGGFAGILRKRLAPCHHTPSSSRWIASRLPSRRSPEKCNGCAVNSGWSSQPAPRRPTLGSDEPFATRPEFCGSSSKMKQRKIR